MSHLLIATPTKAFGKRVARVFPADTVVWPWREDVLSVGRSEAVAELAHSNPAVVALGPGLETNELLELAEAFDRDRPDVVVVLVAEPSLELMEQALKAGARGVVAPGASDDELLAAFQRALDAGRRRGVSAPEPVASRMLCVVAPKGGSGKTTVSTNLASGLALAAPGEVVLVDLDFQFGDVASTLRMTPEHTFADITKAEGEIDITTLKMLLTPNDRGLLALCAPEGLEDADAITQAEVRHVLELLAKEFRYVVVDTGSGLDDGTLVALELSSDIIVLTSTEVPSVRAIRKELAALDMLGLKQPRHFVVNRADARVGLPLNEVEATIGMEAVAAIPSSRSVPISVNQGTPVVVNEPRSSVAEALTRLIDTFLPAKPAASARPEPAWRKLMRAS
jgi:pilus assembly protein CpaE